MYKRQAQHGAFATSERRPLFPRRSHGERVAHEVDTAIKRVKAAPRNPVLDRSAPETSSLELAERDQPALASRNGRYRGIAVVLGDFGLTVMPNSPATGFHTTFLAHAAAPKSTRVRLFTARHTTATNRAKPSHTLRNLHPTR